MVIQCVGQGGWPQAREASGGRRGPQGGGGWVREGPEVTAHRARWLGPMGKSRGCGVGVDTGAVARGTPMALGRDRELWHGMAWSCPMFGDACGELRRMQGEGGA
jgi:hypothetical protein